MSLKLNLFFNLQLRMRFVEDAYYTIERERENIQDTQTYNRVLSLLTYDVERLFIITLSHIKLSYSIFLFI